MLTGIKKILIIAPHADDEILGCGGTISRFKKGRKIKCLVMTHRCPADTTAIEKIKGIEYEQLGYSDEFTDMVPMSDLIKKIESTHRSFKPDVVFIPNRGDINYDHKMIHDACLIAFRKIQQNPPKKLIVYEVPSSTTQGEPFGSNCYVKLTKENIEEKIKLFMNYTNEIRPEPNPRNPRGLETHAKFRGMECNSEYAEGFKILYEIG